MRPAALLAVLLSMFCVNAIGQDAPQRLPAITLNAGIHNIHAEVARTEVEMAVGLMHRRELPPNDGMLFAYETAETRCFWMKNTFIPLSIAFIGDDGTITSIEDMEPLKLDAHCSTKPVRYALEMNQGWFAKRGLKPGVQLQGQPFKR
jgi:uncharacterized membrane protein (UPF0127 family)